MISSLLMTATVAPCVALPDAQGPLRFPLTSSYTQPPLLIPPSVQSNDCPLHAPYLSILPIFLSHCALLWVLKRGVPIRFWYSYCISAGSVCCKAVPLLNKSSNKRVIVMNTFTNVGKFSQNKIVKNTPTVSVSPTNQLSAQFPSYCRGQRSNKEGQFAPDQAGLRDLNSKWNQKPFDRCELLPHRAPAFISFLV